MSGNNKTIVFFSALLTQPRHVKRITAFHNQGYQCTVYGFDRGNYDVNKYPEGVKVVKLGTMDDGKAYLQKLKTARKTVKDVLAKHTDKDTIFFSFGMLFAPFLMLRKKKFIYEISDILYAYPRFDKVRWILKCLDKRIIRNSYKTIMTSRGFYEFYGLNDNKIIVLPNKVSTRMEELCSRQLAELSSSSIRFAFVGAIRYDTVFRFAEVVGKYFPQHSFTFYGGCSPAIMSAEEYDAFIAKYDNVYSHGVFKNPEDLPTIYANVDVIVSCYNVHSLNERIAEPNKLYEALYFCKPIVVSDNIFLSKRVKELQCGYIIDANQEENIINFINGLDVDDINAISKREYNMPLSEMVDQTELEISRI